MKRLRTNRVLVFLVVFPCGFLSASSRFHGAEPDENETTSASTLRIATFNVALYRQRSGELALELADRDSQQAAAIATVIQHVRPDLLLLNEIDYQADSAALQNLLKNYLAVDGKLKGVEYPYFYTAEVNTGIVSGCDLDGNGESTDPADCFGFGQYPGQYGMAVLSRFPIDEGRVRTFRTFRWLEMPASLLPVDPKTGEKFYPPSTTDILRLSSKSHWDVPIQWRHHTLHFLVCHPTPPVFDGPEDRNGHRNHDEIRFWADYIDITKGDYIQDDDGRRGGLDGDANFVIAGDLNADPHDGDSYSGAIHQLLRHPRVNAEFIPSSRGGVAASKRQGKRNLQHRGDPAHDTGDFGDSGSGNLRIDYVLPSQNVRVVAGGVFWPAAGEPGDQAAIDASDHRLVWIDVELAL